MPKNSTPITPEAQRIISLTTIQCSIDGHNTKPPQCAHDIQQAIDEGFQELEWSESISAAVCEIAIAAERTKNPNVLEPLDNAFQALTNTPLVPCDVLFPKNLKAVG